jgi:methyl-accepting chemotaxis protein
LGKALTPYLTTQWPGRARLFSVFPLNNQHKKNKVMNEKRRNEIRVLEKRLETELSESAKKLWDLLTEIREAYEQVRDDEQESRDNIPESLQDSERATASDESISNLEDLVSDLETAEQAVEEIVNGIADLVQKSDESKGQDV